MKILPIITLIAAAAVSACAPGAASVAPASMAGAYDTTSCAKVPALLAQARSEVSTLSARQNGAAAQDAVSVFLIGLPTSGLSQNNVQGELASAKGRVLALEARQGGC